MALSLTVEVLPRAVPASSSTPRHGSRRRVPDSRLGAAARCLSQMLAEQGGLGASWRGRGFGDRVERVRAELIPIASADALADSYAREANRTNEVEAAYALRWLELTGDTIRPPWQVLVGAN